jgi:hypothetical protein
MEEMLSTPLFVEADGPSGSHGPEQQTASSSAPSPYRERYEVAARQHVSRQTNNLDNELESMELEHLDLENDYFILPSLGQSSLSGGDHPTPRELQSKSVLETVSSCYPTGARPKLAMV